MCVRRAAARCGEDVQLQSWGWTDLSSESEAASDSEAEPQGFLQPRIMSRRCLRLDDGLLDRSLPHSSASFSVGGTSWRSTRLLKSRRSQQLSASCSESLLLHAPRRPTGASLPSSSLHSVASDASLLSSLLDESSAQETTLVDTFWGLDHDLDPKESTVIAEQSTVLADQTLIGSDGRCPRHVVETLSRVYCKDCELHSGRKESICCSSMTGSGPSPPAAPETTIIYSGARSRKSRTGVLQLCLDSSRLCVWRAAACCVSALTHTWQACRGLASTASQVNMQTGHRRGARSAHCRAMKESSTSQKELHPNGSLCDDCKEKQRSEPGPVSPSSSWAAAASCASALLWSAAVFTGKMAGDAYRWLNGRWPHMTPRFLLTRVPLRLLLLLLLFGLCWFGPAALRSVLPAVSVAEWRTVVSDVPGLSSIYSLVPPQSQTAEEPREVQLYVEPPNSRAPPPGGEQQQEEEAAAADEESARLARLERRLAALWQRVEAGGRRAEQRHREVLRLYAALQQQLVSAQSGGEGVEPWLSGLLDQRLSRLRRRLDEERRDQDVSQQRRQTSRLDQLELQLQALAARSEELQRRQEAAAVSSPPATTLPAAVSVGVDRQSHDALLAEVARLDAALEDVRRDVEDGCRRLDTIQQTISAQVSAQVREEVRTLVYGNQLTVRGGASGGDAGLPESLLQWLSQRYVSGADLQVSLASLELSVLQNVSRQLEQRHSEEAVREAVLHAAGAAVTPSDVHAIVKNALRLFSEDRTGLADYALESGGGSILSTRCSETYETKAALLSLFGLPLWYFSQSPRVVIQPDVHPGNCWAFRGSTGFLVIRLSMRILPTAFSLEHIPKALAPSGTLRSAPRDFSVYGLDDESQEGGKLLGSYSYAEDGDALQTYSVSEENDQAFQIIEVQVMSNWGHQEYTCMYRFRVHGTPADV